MDVIECDSCHQMLPKKNICSMNVVDKNIEITASLKTFMNAENKNFPLNVCRTYCYTAFQKNEIPKFSVLNNMKLNEIPNEINLLNNYELLLIQLAKCFHTIYRLKSVTSYKNREQMFGFKGKMNFLTI